MSYGTILLENETGADGCWIKVSKLKPSEERALYDAIVKIILGFAHERIEFRPAPDDPGRPVPPHGSGP